MTTFHFYRCYILITFRSGFRLDFNSVERVIEYLDVQQEAPAIVESCRAPAYWPSSSGNLVVEDLVVKYASHLPPVLHKVTFIVNPSEKIGVVRCNASLLLSLHHC